MSISREKVNWIVNLLEYIAYVLRKHFETNRLPQLHKTHAVNFVWNKKQNLNELKLFILGICLSLEQEFYSTAIFIMLIKILYSKASFYACSYWLMLTCCNIDILWEILFWDGYEWTSLGWPWIETPRPETDKLQTKLNKDHKHS